MFTLGIQQKPTLFAYEKRCAAFAHLGRYSEALMDAEFILKNGPPGGEQPAARLRVKAINDFLRKRDDTGPGKPRSLLLVAGTISTATSTASLVASRS